jgi:hypothetical protein
MATTFDMSQDNPPDLNDGIMKFMSRIFAPMLKDDFSEHSSPFAIENPLTAESFYIDEDSDTPFEEIEKVQDILSDGFHPGLATLTRNQWLCTATMLVVAVIDGLRSSCPDNLTPVPFANLNPDETNAMNILGKAIGALERYFTDPLAEHPSQWQQCLRCLKTNHIEITAEHWQAHLLTCGQMTEAAMASILNKYCHDFDKEVMEWVHDKQAFAFDQVVEIVVTSNPPPFEADPRILEFIKRSALDLKAKAESEAIKTAKRNARTFFEQNKVVELGKFDADLATIRNDCERRLQEARDIARREIESVQEECQRRLQEAKDKAVLDVTNLCTELKAQREANKAEAHNNLITSVRASNRKQTHDARKPKPIRTHSRTPSEHGSDISDARVSETDYGEPSALTQEAMMAIDTNPPAPLENSPTPKADVPLISAAPMAAAAPQMADMMKFMQDCMDQQSKRISMQLEPILARIDQLEQYDAPPILDVRDQIPDYTADEYNTWQNPHSETDFLAYQQPPNAPSELEYVDLPPDLPPPRIDDEDANMYDYDLGKENDERYAQQDADRELARQGLGPTDDEIHAEGGSEARVRANAAAREKRRAEYLAQNPPANNPQPGLRASQPITVNSTPPAPAKPTTFASAATSAPKAGSVWTVVGKKPNTRPRMPAPATAAPSTKQPLSIETLSARRTTKTAIIDHGFATFGIRLSDKMRKPQLIVAYQQLAANPKLNPPQPNPPSIGQQPNRPRQQSAPRPFTSEWTICRKPGTEAVDFRRPFNGDPLALVRHIQTSLRQHSAEAEPPLTLVAGRWSVGLTSNFVLTFAGKPRAELVKNYKGALLSKFPGGLFNLIRNDGLRKFIVNGVPCIRKPNGRLPSADELFTEFQRNNAHIRQWDLPEHPAWTRGALMDTTKTETSFTFLLSIPNIATNRIL